MTSSQAHALVRVAVGTCWGITGAVWLAGALYNGFRGPRVRTRRISSNLWSGVVVAAFAAAIGRALPGSNWHSVDTTWIRILGVILLVCSTAFTLWARFALGTMWSSAPSVKVQHQLRTTGPYGVTRHPIYTGLLGMVIGTVLLVGLGQWLLLVPAGFLFVEIRIHQEERLMLEVFPETYPQYRRVVPQLVPGLRRLHRAVNT